MPFAQTSFAPPALPPAAVTEALSLADAQPSLHLALVPITRPGNLQMLLPLRGIGALSLSWVMPGVCPYGLLVPIAWLTLRQHLGAGGGLSRWGSSLLPHPGLLQIQAPSRPSPSATQACFFICGVAIKLPPEYL
uniref:Uncharacterized protein n=1 Tax=Myotis myotis TaxID=51298 RepID=A0A7J7VI86_MYOMY|nr:hypothetical protein mMyoMyo1_008326 [Myotis myotis]